MPQSPLQAMPFRGDPDVEAVHDFFRSERQYAGDTLWTFGTSLKSAYVNTFEFLNQAPIVQLWRDGNGVVQAISRIGLAAGEWFYLAAPGYRRAELIREIIDQADSSLELLSGLPSWRTVNYQSDSTGAKHLEDCGYRADGYDQVYMTRSLGTAIAPIPVPTGTSLRSLDPDDPAQVFERGDAQTDAFLDGQSYADVSSWMTRTMRHQLA